MKIKKIILIVIILLLTTSYIFILSSYESQKNDKKQNTLIKESKIESVTIDKAINYINVNKIDYLDILNITFNDEKEVSNQQKLKLAYYYTGEESNYDQGVGYTKLFSYLYRVFGENIKVTNEDIVSNQKVVVKFDETNEVYVKSDNDVQLKEKYVPSYRYIIDFKNEDDTYILLVNKFYESNNKVYSSYGKLINNVDELFTIPDDEDHATYIKNYVNSNYEKLKKEKEIEVYKYVLIKEKSTLILKSYEISK